VNDSLVTVVTLTKNRKHLLRRALASVAGQRGARCEQVVVADGCDQLRDPAERAALEREFPHARIVYVDRAEHPHMPAGYISERLAYLRNLGIDHARGEFVAFLDDDCEYQHDHVASLVALLAARPECGVAHSWRLLLNPDGTPHVLSRENPWFPVDSEEARVRSFQKLCGRGIFEAGTAIVRDRLEDGSRGYTQTVDTNEFLVRRTLLDRIRFRTKLSSMEKVLGSTEDVAFSFDLMRNRVGVVCSERATLNYYMGGYSNNGVAAIRG
jgi:glycosyltransferase involved in cell wall biosynthesis